MAVVYDNWERLVTATLRREQLRLTALRTPSDLSSLSLSSASPTFNFSSHSRQVSSFNSLSLLIGDSFTYDQILKATDYLSDINLIKHGHSGDFYYGVLKSGIQVVVKKINMSSIDKELCFMSELEICGMLYHSRLIPLLGYCMENAYDKFLIYEYMPNKDLSSSLRREDNQGIPSLDWATRLKIATGSAEALCYLHDKCFPPLVHSDIQASSILLDDDFEVRLGSLTRVCIEEKDSNQNRIARFLRLPKGFERSTSGTSNSKCAYDVYCFGKVLLELVTGKVGLSAVNESNTRDWMENTLHYILPDYKKFVASIVDPSLIIDEHLLTEAWAVAFVAKACLSSKPSKRPQMTEILEALEFTKSAEFASGNFQLTDNPSSVVLVPPMTKGPEGSKMTGWLLQAITNTTSSGSSTASGSQGHLEANGSEKAYPNGMILASPSLRIFTYSELQDATRNFRIDTLLGEGEFGKVYKGLLHEKSKSKSGGKSIIAVKKLYNVPLQGIQEWQSVVNLLGWLSHPNLVKLLGCCWEKQEPLLVYEFMQKGSLDCHLFAKGSFHQPLPWDIRLKILIGAARGLAFLHALERQGFFYQKKEREGFYGYFQPSNILLDGAYNAKISGFGVARIDPLEFDGEAHPIKYTKGKYAYAAPEYVWEGDLCLESDVYGFGVVLTQMLTGFDVYRSNLGTYWLHNAVKNTGTRKLKEIMDPRLEGKYPSDAALEMARLAQLCLSYVPKYRPSMQQVVKILERIESNGWLLQASSGSSTASGSRGHLEANGSEKAYPNGDILASLSLKIFTYSELQDATRNFRIDTLLGEGEFGKVYKGLLHEKSKSKSGGETIIAVKKLYNVRLQGVQEWQSVVNLLGRLSHPNLVKLFGCCWEKQEPLLVYEFMQKGSLDCHLFAKGSAHQPLPWDIRLKILIGAARGLAFLHASERQGFFYQKKEREGFYGYFQPSNILLDGAYNAKISGLGVARIDPLEFDDEAHPIKHTKGKYAYAAPEYVSEGDLCLESDVYGFGVVLTQMLTGLDVYRSNFRTYWLHNAVKNTDTRKLKEIMDPRLEGKYPSDAALEMAQLAQLCLSYVPKYRPSMQQVVKILERIESNGQQSL